MFWIKTDEERVHAVKLWILFRGGTGWNRSEVFSALNGPLKDWMLFHLSLFGISPFTPGRLDCLSPTFILRTAPPNVPSAYYFLCCDSISASIVFCHSTILGWSISIYLLFVVVGFASEYCSEHIRCNSRSQFYFICWQLKQSFSMKYETLNSTRLSNETKYFRAQIGN